MLPKLTLRSPIIMILPQNLVEVSYENLRGGGHANFFIILQISEHIKRGYTLGNVLEGGGVGPKHPSQPPQYPYLEPRVRLKL
jgi:hypothetical protein